MSINRPRDNPTSSPCVGKCSHNVGDYLCRGCWRTPEEVRDWNTYSDAQKIELKKELPGRKDKCTKWWPDER